jgi:hypothetical protein
MSGGCPNGMAAVAAIEPFSLRQPPPLRGSVASATVAGVYDAATASFGGLPRAGGAGVSAEMQVSVRGSYLV